MVKFPSHFRSRRREWAVIVGIAVLLIPVSFLVMALTFGALFLVTYIGFLALFTLWNSWAMLDLMRAAWAARRVPGVLGLRLSLIALGLPSALLWGIPVDLPGRPKGPLMIAALLALVFTAAQFMLTARRSRRDYFAPVYNLFNLVFLAAFAAAEHGPPPEAGPLPYVFARSVGLFQMINMSFIAGFAPLFILPSYLPKVKGLRWPANAPEGPGFDAFLRRLPRARSTVHRAAWALSKASGGLVLYAAVALLVLSPLAAGGVGSFYSGYQARPPPASPGVQFAATAGAFTDILRPPPNWHELVDREIALAKELRMDYIRYDLKTELLSDNASIAALGEAVGSIRAAGLDVILNPFGMERWSTSHPTFEELNRTLAQDSLLLAQRFHPAYIFPFFEPNGQVEINLGHGMPTAAWVGAVASVARGIKAVSPITRILIEVAGGPQGLELFAALMATPAPLDAVGFDLYPGSLSDLDSIAAYAALARANPARGFWISEFGLESIQFGEVAQSHFVSDLVLRGRTQWNVTGFCVWALEDNAGLGMDKALVSGLGITALDGRRKPAFFAYRDVIAAVRA